MATSNPIVPGAGDVVLKHEASSAGSNYSVRQVPGATQVLCNSREGALTFATLFAERHQSPSGRSRTARTRSSRQPHMKADDRDARFRRP